MDGWIDETGDIDRQIDVVGTSLDSGLWTLDVDT